MYRIVKDTKGEGGRAGKEEKNPTESKPGLIIEGKRCLANTIPYPLSHRNLHSSCTTHNFFLSHFRCMPTQQQQPKKKKEKSARI